MESKNLEAVAQRSMEYMPTLTPCPTTPMLVRLTSPQGVLGPVEVPDTDVSVPAKDTAAIAEGSASKRKKQKQSPQLARNKSHAENEVYRSPPQKITD